MANIYYYKNSQEGFKKLSLEDLKAAPQYHSHWSYAFGIINQSQGGIQNNTTLNLKQYTGPLLYKNNNELDDRYINNNGVYYFQDINEDYVHVGMPGWEQGAIPYSTEDEQLENTLKKIPLGTSILYPYLITTGMLSANGQDFYAPIKCNYILPENAKITLSGKYVIRQNGIYLFTSSDPEDQTTWNYVGNYPIQYENVPSNNYNHQTIISSTEEGWYVDYNKTDYSDEDAPQFPYNAFSSQMRLHRHSAIAQTTTYSYKGQTATASSNCAGIGWLSGSVEFIDLKLTFNEPTPSP